MTSEQQYNWLQYIKDNQSEIIEKIIAARKQNGLEKEWVAEKAGYSISQYIKIEQGEREIDHEDIYRISTAIADYKDSLDPPFQRILKKVNLQINQLFDRWENYVLEWFPSTETLFNHISLRKLTLYAIFWLAIFLFIVLNRITLDDIGFLFGTCVKKVQILTDAIFM